MAGLIGSAGPGRLSPHADVSRHQSPRHGLRIIRESDSPSVQKIQCTHIQRGWNPDPGTQCYESFGEENATVAVVKTTIDMRGADIHEILSAENSRGLDHDPHRHGRAAACVSVEHRLVGRGQSHFYLVRSALLSEAGFLAGRR